MPGGDGFAIHDPAKKSRLRPLSHLTLGLDDGIHLLSVWRESMDGAVTGWLDGL